MEDKQRVYIKGDHNRGNEIIKLLEDLGGKNTYRYNGEDNNIYYYIAPDGVIKVVASTYMVFPFIEEFYKEIKLPRWKPKNEECYYFIDDRGTIITSMWNKYGERKDNLRYEFGNCFRTKEEAEVARDKIKNFLNKVSKLETRLKNLERSILESDNNIKKLEKLTSDIRARNLEKVSKGTWIF